MLYNHKLQLKCRPLDNFPVGVLIALTIAKNLAKWLDKGFKHQTMYNTYMNIRLVLK